MGRPLPGAPTTPDRGGVTESPTGARSVLEGRRVGYAPYSADLRAPGDRRRFCYYAERRGVRFEVADPGRSYDVVVVSSTADIGAWRRYRAGGAKVVYELIDSYLALPRLQPRSLLRGVAKFASGETRTLLIDYRRAIEDMVRRADAVVCSTEEQRVEYQRLCPNVHLILDAHTEIVGDPKSDYAVGPTLNLVWEGLPYTLDAFEQVKPVLDELASDGPLALHLITDLRFARYAHRFRRQRTETIASRILPSTYLYEWNPHLLAALVTACDVAVIPLDLSDPFARGKPENKLLLFWRLGMPVVTSASPAYERAMAAAGLDLACRTPAEWKDALGRVLQSEMVRRDAGTKGRQFVEEQHPEEQLLGRWDRLFESVFSTQDAG